jgi:predicted AlkP superfamily phosphohydrolase/phosphomutase
MTGCNPGKHGVFDFIQAQGADFSLVNATKIRQPTLWQRLSAAGYRVGVLNVPVTYPPQPVDGFMVSGILSPKHGQICYPADLFDRYREELGEYRVAPSVQYKSGREEAFIADLYDLIRSHGDWALTLMDQEPWDVLMVHFIALDIMMHALWRFMDESHPRFEDGPFRHAIRDGYRIVDDYVGRMLARLPEDAWIIVMSDHGFGPLYKIVNLNVFLLEKGLLRLKRDPLTRLKTVAFKRGLTPATVYRMVETIGLQNVAARVSKSTRNSVVGKFLSFDAVDWERTIAYSMGHVGQIYLNSKNVPANGDGREYRERRQRVIDAMRALRDDGGRPLVSEIIVREETYHGPYEKHGPDIHVVLDEYQMIAFPLFATNNQVITDQIRGDSGCHRREGIFIAQGAGIRRGATLPETNILDLAPTIMALLGEPIPAIMDGRVLEEIFTEAPEITYGEQAADDIGLREHQALDEDEMLQIEKRLRGLGYL